MIHSLLFLMLLFMPFAPVIAQNIEHYTPPPMFSSESQARKKALQDFTQIIDSADILQPSPYNHHHSKVFKTPPAPPSKPDMAQTPQLTVPNLQAQDIYKMLND